MKLSGPRASRRQVATLARRSGHYDVRRPADVNARPGDETDPAAAGRRRHRGAGRQPCGPTSRAGWTVAPPRAADWPLERLLAAKGATRGQRRPAGPRRGGDRRGHRRGDPHATWWAAHDPPRRRDRGHGLRQPGRDRAEVAAEPGASVVHRDDVLPDVPRSPGKGEVLWRSLAATTGRPARLRRRRPRGVLVRPCVTGLLGPLLTDRSVALVKGVYDRPLRDGDLVLLPAAAAGSPSWSPARCSTCTGPSSPGVVQPLAGEYAARRGAARAAAVPDRLRRRAGAPGRHPGRRRAGRDRPGRPRRAAAPAPGRRRRSAGWRPRSGRSRYAGSTRPDGLLRPHGLGATLAQFERDDGGLRGHDATTSAATERPPIQRLDGSTRRDRAAPPPRAHRVSLEQGALCDHGARREPRTALVPARRRRAASTSYAAVAASSRGCRGADSAGEVLVVCAALSDTDRHAVRRTTNGRLDDLHDRRRRDVGPDARPRPDDVRAGRTSGMANSTLWFVHHMLFVGPVPSGRSTARRRATGSAYVDYNQAFADAVAEEAAPTARASSCRTTTSPWSRRCCGAIRPDLRIGHFSHTPWAPPDYFRLLPEPMGRAVLDGLLGADRGRVPHRRWAEAFARCCAEVLGAEVDGRSRADRWSSSTTVGRHAVDVHPLGVDVPTACAPGRARTRRRRPARRPPRAGRRPSRASCGSTAPSCPRTSSEGCWRSASC